MPEVSVNHSATDHRGLKTKLHAQLLEEIDLESLNRLSEGVARDRVGVNIRDLLHRERTPLASIERERIVLEILDELFGLGPLEPLLADGTISDILVNGSQKIFVERRGKLEATGARFDDDAHLMRIIDRWVVERAFSDYRRLAKLRGQPAPAEFSLNLSGHTLSSPEFADFMRAKLARSCVRAASSSSSMRRAR